jgi:hypothetical protein
VCGVGLSLVAAGAAASATYKVRVESDMHGLDVKVETVENTGGLIVRLTNATAQKVRCTLRVDAQPQPLMRKTVYVEPGETADAPFGASRKWFNVDVKVECGK